MCVCAFHHIILLHVKNRGHAVNIYMLDLDFETTFAWHPSGHSRDQNLPTLGCWDYLGFTCYLNPFQSNPSKHLTLTVPHMHYAQSCTQTYCSMSRVYMVFCRCCWWLQVAQFHLDNVHLEWSFFQATRERFCQVTPEHHIRKHSRLKVRVWEVEPRHPSGRSSQFEPEMGKAT